MRKNGKRYFKESYASYEHSFEYDDIVKDIADRARLIMQDDPNIEEEEAVQQAMDDGMFRTADQWTMIEEYADPQDCDVFDSAWYALSSDVQDMLVDMLGDGYDESYKPVRRPHKRMREARNLSEAKKYTQSDIKELIRKGAATDITNWSDEQITELRRKHSIELVGTSLGVYGPNAGLYRDVDTGELYAIRARNAVLGMMPIRYADK